MRALTLTIVAAGFTVSAGLAGVAGAFLADRSPPLTVVQADLLTPVVRPGEHFRIGFTLNRTRSCATHLDRIMQDSSKERAILDDIDLAASPGVIGTDTFTLSVKVPEGFADGPALYVSTAQYRCNIVHYLWPITMPPREFAFEVRR